ncbi:MAG: glycerophosphodiester phosphodiesterase family protein [Acidimicrobiales bacterium]|jgi:glycerophosphoryl diester phosphodiesterase|nr:glycerophosphodiester phosphodiesterase family protein [Acidimicrobiales bacterium]
MRRLLLALTAVLAMFATACGDDGEAASPTTTTTSTSTTTTTSTTATTTTTVPAPVIPTPEASTLEGILALGRPVVAGHAGGDQAWPHSTMFAFREAALAGTEVLEMDVMLTSDGELVVQHDDTVDRTTESTGAVSELTYDDLQALDNGYWWSDEWSSHDRPVEAYIYRGIRTGDVPPPEGYTADDFRVETFRSIAEAFPDHVLDVEIKVPRGDDGEADLDFAIEGAHVLADQVVELGRTDSVIVVSFDDDVMAAFHDVAPDVATSPGTANMTAWGLGGGELLPSDRVLQLPPSFDGLDVLRLPGLLDKARAEGYAIWVWPNSRDQENGDYYAELITEFNVDGVIAGNPAEAVERYRAEGFIP